MPAGAEHKFLCDHVVDGRILMPATSYVVTAWEALAHIKVRHPSPCAMRAWQYPAGTALTGVHPCSLQLDRG